MEEKVRAFLELATRKNASDIFIIAGRPLSVKISSFYLTIIPPHCNRIFLQKVAKSPPGHGRFKMPSACALGINRGILLSLTMRENLRIFPHCPFTQGSQRQPAVTLQRFSPVKMRLGRSSFCIQNHPAATDKRLLRGVLFCIIYPVFCRDGQSGILYPRGCAGCWSGAYK